MHGAVYRNHPTPSGLDRYLLSVTTDQGYDSSREAAEAINAAFPDVDQLDIESYPDDGVAHLDFPNSAEITLIVPNDAPDEKYVVVECAGKALPIQINPAQLRRLVTRNILELDCSSGDDPDLSARYDYYRKKN
jgi:hypothetical protein